MEELTEDQIIQALNANADLLTAVTTHVVGTDHGKGIVDQKATALYQANIGDEVKNIYDRIDGDAFTVLGEKPGEGDDGKKVKTYDFVKNLFTELKGYRDKGEEFSKDAEVQRLTAEVEKLKTEGGGAHWQKTLETERTKWQTEKQTLTTENKNLKDSIYSSSVSTDLANAKANLKFNPDIPQTAVDAVYNAVKADLVKNSKMEGEKIVYLNADGSMIMGDAGFKSAQSILEERLKDVLLQVDVPGGGGAEETIKGSIKITKVEGKDDVKSLVLTPGSFKTQVEFNKVATEALIAEGIPKSSAEFTKLLDKAKIEYKANELPRS